MRIPRVLKILGHNVPVKHRKNLRGFLGLADRDTLKIALLEKQPKYLKNETLLHEILHLIVYIMGLHSFFRSEDAQEAFVSALSPVLHAAITENNLYG